MKIQIGYGTGFQTVEVPDKNLVGVLAPNSVEIPLRGEAEVLRALDNPISAPPMEAVFSAGERVAIITSDITRPLPGYKVVPHVVGRLLAAGVRADDITVVFALGIHRPHTKDEMRRLVGDMVFDTVRCVDSTSGDFIHMGVTSMGTPVDIAEAVARADRRIGVGNIEYHYFAGYSGGAKAVMPGVSTGAAIRHNHSRMVLPQAAAGQIDGNPVRMDIEEALDFCPLDYIVNVVLDENKEIIRAVAGHPIHAHRVGCRFLDSLFRKDLPCAADIVIASQGGAPKDINLYQTQKALDNAAKAVRKGGIIILAGACGEGMGEEVFESWMLEAARPQELIDRITADFRLGGHKAAAIALTLEKAEIFLVSDMEPRFVESIFMRPFASVQQALDAALQALGGDSGVLVMPFAGSTLPVVARQ